MKNTTKKDKIWLIQEKKNIQQQISTSTIGFMARNAGRNGEEK